MSTPVHCDVYDRAIAGAQQQFTVGTMACCVFLRHRPAMHGLYRDRAGSIDRGEVPYRVAARLATRDGHRTKKN